MRNYILVLAIALLLLKLDALQIRDTRNRTFEITYTELCAQELQSFTTTRNKNGKEIGESWQGIALLPWLSKLGYPDWHSLNSISADGYEVRMHRMDLDRMPAFLAIQQDGQLIAENDLRLIYPTARENLWLRGVKSIQLEAFTGIPSPRQIFSWEAESKDFNWDQASLSFTELMSQAFHQSKGTVVLADINMNCIALDYPTQLATVSLVYDNQGKLQLSGLNLQGKLRLDDIVYLQCGPYAFLRNVAKSELKSLGIALNWDWTSLELYQLKAEARKFQDGINQEGSTSEEWLELH